MTTSMRTPQPPVQDEQLDAAGRSLSDALRISFTILKVIMIILVVAFLASGFRTVGPDEKALVLRFGKIQGIGDEAILGPGAHWVFPYPIDELVQDPGREEHQPAGQHLLVQGDPRRHPGRGRQAEELPGRASSIRWWKDTA